MLGVVDEESGQAVIASVTETWLAASWPTVNDTLPAVAEAEAVAVAALELLVAVNEFSAFAPTAAFAVVASAATAVFKDCSAVVWVCSVVSCVFSWVCGADSIAISFVMMPLVSRPLDRPVRPSPDSEVVLRLARCWWSPVSPSLDDGGSRCGSGSPLPHRLFLRVSRGASAPAGAASSPGRASRYRTGTGCSRASS